MQRLVALASFCLLITAWNANVLAQTQAQAEAQAREAACPNFQSAVESVSFPEEAIALRMSAGDAVVAFTIRADGTVVDQAVKSATHPSFGAAALSVVSRLRCNRRAASLRITLPVNFDLFGSSYLAAQTGCKQTLPANGDEPGFPREAIQAGLEKGEVVIDFKVDEEGHPFDIVVAESTHPFFSRSAYRFIELLDCKGAPKNKLMSMPFGYRLE
jgi:TonB family protein